MMFKRFQQDPLKQHKRELEKTRKQIERQARELEARLNGNLEDGRPQQKLDSTPSASPTKLLFPQDSENAEPDDFVPRQKKNRSSSNPKQLKVDQRLARNRFLILCGLAVLLLALTLRILF